MQGKQSGAAAHRGLPAFHEDAIVMRTSIRHLEWDKHQPPHLAAQLLSGGFTHPHLEHIQSSAESAA